LHVIAGNILAALGAGMSWFLAATTGWPQRGQAGERLISGGRGVACQRGAERIVGAREAMTCPAPTFILRDRILTLARFCGVALEEQSLAEEQDFVTLRVRLGGVALRGCQVRLPGDPAAHRHTPNVITVQGSGHRASRTWPPRRDGAFNFDAIVGHLLSLVQGELRSPQTTLSVASRVPETASGLHVIHAAAVHFGAMSADTRPETLLKAVADANVRARIETHSRRGGVTDGDLRLLGDTVGLFFGRAMKLDFDPLDTHGTSRLVVIVVGSEGSGRLVRRHVLLLARSGDEITAVDPAGKGLTIIGADELRRALDLAALGKNRRRPWVGAVGPRST
jgi:hypothetical protein